MPTYTLQILHASDLEGGVDAIANAPNFATIIDTFEDGFANTIVLSAGDNYIPGPFFDAAEDESVVDELVAAYEAIYNDTGFAGLATASGRVDVTIMNVIGFDASAVGNHEFDAGTAAFAEIIAASADGATNADIAWFGAQFPYLSVNLDFTGDASLGGLYTSDILSNLNYAQTPAELLADADTPKIAPATIIEEGGEQIGVIGATTQIVTTISSTGDVNDTTGGVNDMAALAAAIQPQIDALTEQGVNKIVLVSHLQQIALEKELAGLLDGVDVIIAGGSDTLLADETDELRAGDEAAEGYPFATTDASGNPVAIVSTDGEYSYVGRLVVDFDENGVVQLDSIDSAVSGAYATTDEGVVAVTGAASAQAAIDASEKGSLVQDLANAVGEVNAAADGETFGETSVYLDGRRATVRTQESNLGNLTADANLAAAQEADSSVLVSLKNGGGIRSDIGEVVTDAEGNVTGFAPTAANPFADKEEGEISQLDLQNALRFNNKLALITLSPEDLKIILEHSISRSSDDPENQQGRYPQVGGLKFSYDAEETAQVIATDENGDYILDADGELLLTTPGERVKSVVIETEDGPVTIVENGEVVADAPAEIRIVTLNFIAGGGDGYPYPELGEDIVFVTEEGGVTADGDADNLLGEQAALAQYLEENFPIDGENVFSEAETGIGIDSRIQQITQRSDNVIAPQESKSITLNQISILDSGSGDGGAEIVAYENGLAYVTNGEEDRIDIFNVETGVKVDDIDLSGIEGFDGVQSVAVKNGVVAAAVSREEADGSVVTFDTETLEQTAEIVVGNLPDMVTFSPDGSKTLVANEGEPVESGDPVGSVSIIDISAGVANAAVVFVDFTALDNVPGSVLEAAGIRIFPGHKPSEDLEPEYITVSPDGSKAYVSLQENNAFAIIDVESGELLDVVSQGSVDHSIEGNGIDASDRDDAINIKTWDVKGLRQADAISSFEIDGETFVISANEGDGREYEFETRDEIIDEDRVKDLVLDENAYPDAETLQQDENLGRLTVSTIDGDIDGDGDIDQITAFGSRSVSIFDAAGNVVWDSGDFLARIAAEFNAAEFQGNDGDFDNRSDNKGVEPEAVTVGVIGEHTFAFVGLERDSGIVVMDITDPREPSFVQYLNAGDDGVSPEGLVFVSAEDSPTDAPLLLASYEVSGTTIAFEIDTSALDVQSGDSGSDRLIGDEFSETIRARGGDDIVRAGDGDDFVFGGAGDDNLLGQDGDDRILGGKDDDVIRGGEGNDDLRGQAGDDQVLGGAGDDALRGGGGDDVLRGGAGDDTLTGGAGDDELVGGAGADVFVFGADFGADTVRGFNSGEDVMSFSATASFDDLVITQSGSDAVVSLGADSVTLLGANADDLGEDDFIFA